MDFKEKILKEKLLTKHLKEISIFDKERLADLILNKKKFQPEDIDAVFKCVVVVLEKLEVHEDEIKVTSETVENININAKFIEIFEPIIDELKKIMGNDISGKDILDEIACFFVTLDDDASIDDKFRAIQEIKTNAWKTMYNKRKSVENLIWDYPVLKAKEIILIFRCISIVLLELDLQDQEKILLEKLYNSR